MMLLSVMAQRLSGEYRPEGAIMKKHLFASAAFTGLIAATSAMAADAPTAAPTDQAAPTAASVSEAQMVPFNWNRCYFGGHVAYGWGNDHNTFGTALESDPTEGEGLPGEAGPYNHSTHGAGFGVQAGCNWQVSANWLFGGELEFMWSEIAGHKTTPEDDTPPGDPGEFSRFASSNRWDGDIALRFGHVWANDLLYGKVGAVLGDFRYRETHDDFPTTHSCPGGVGTCSVSYTNSRTGLLLGIGWEHAWGLNWTTKIEYNYDDFGTQNIPYPDAAAAIQSFKVRDTKSILKVGVNFYFP
jgi:outer membrane immunogenic protein